MTEIEAWIQGARNYDEGLILYNQYGKNHNLKRVFMRGPDEYNIEKLLSELEQLREMGRPVITAPAPETKMDIPQVATANYEDRSHLIVQDKPAKHKELHDQWRKAYKEASHIHQTQLVMEMHKNERGEAAGRIIHLFENIIAPCWDQLDHFEKYGSWPESQVETKTYETPAEILTRRNTLRTYIARSKGDPKKITKIEAWQNELDVLNEKLNVSEQ
jgi:hypothetical protein